MNEALDKWMQRALAAALVALAAALVGMGVALYAPAPQARPATMVVR